jgi:hypothetical protein
MGEDSTPSDTISAKPMFKYISDEEITQADFAKRINESAQTLTNWKDRGIPWRKIRRVSSEMGISIEQYLDRAAGKFLRVATYGLPRTARPKAPVLNIRPDVIELPMYGAEAGQGPPRAAPEAEVVVGGMQVSREWANLHLRGVSGFANLVLITAVGNSNSPTIENGDILVVDRGATEPRTDQFYVFGASSSEEIFIKRVQRLMDKEQTIIVKGDNQIKEEIFDRRNLPRVIGRVVYRWHGNSP